MTVKILTFVLLFKVELNYGNINIIFSFLTMCMNFWLSQSTVQLGQISQSKHNKCDKPETSKVKTRAIVINKAWHRLHEH